MARGRGTSKRTLERDSARDESNERASRRKRPRRKNALAQPNDGDSTDDDNNEEEERREGEGEEEEEENDGGGNNNDDENEDEHGSESLDSKSASKTPEPIKTLIEDLQRAISKVKKEYPEAFKSQKSIKLSFGVDWEFVEGQRKLTNPIHQEERDRLWESFYHNCVGSSKQKAYEDVLSTHGLNEIELHKRVDKNSTEQGMTRNIGPEIPERAYRHLMKLYLKLCQRRVHDQFKKVWKAKLGDPESIQTGTQRANYQSLYFDWNNPHDYSRGATYKLEWKWLSTCVVSNGKVFRKEYYHPSGTSPDQLAATLEKAIAGYTAEEVCSLAPRLIQALLVKDGRSPPGWFKDQAAEEVRNKFEKQAVDQYLEKHPDQQDQITRSERQDIMNRYLAQNDNDLRLEEETAMALGKLTSDHRKDWQDKGMERVARQIYNTCVSQCTDKNIAFVPVMEKNIPSSSNDIAQQDEHRLASPSGNDVAQHNEYRPVNDESPDKPERNSSERDALAQHITQREDGSIAVDDISSATGTQLAQKY